ncbi:cysteine hydrolase family protein [Nocardioides sp. LHG3406-4]|uniref:cysteine hydrolase family protein n=1 Tax=Nocardioides sp. LHG3406-4 TaxID=2804575 RepID=UPI003CF565F5
MDASPTPPWLVVIDMQVAFGDPLSEWTTHNYDRAEQVVSRLADGFEDRVVWTRFVRDPAEPGQWRSYYDRWPSFRVPEDDALWELTLPVAAGARVLSRPSFSKWGPGLQAIVGDAPLVMCGVATECCVLGTVLAAADAGRQVTVVADACAGATEGLHGQALVLMEQLDPLVRVTTSDRI